MNLASETAFETVRGLLRTLFDVPDDQIQPGAHLMDDLDLDSLDAVELAHSLEDEVGVTLEDEDLGSLRTVRDIVAFVSERAHGASA